MEPPWGTGHGGVERSVAEVIRRHETLRTRIETTAEGQGVQVIDEPGAFRLEVVDLSSLTSSIDESAPRQHIKAEAEPGPLTSPGNCSV